MEFLGNEFSATLLNFDTCHLICICNHLVNRNDYHTLNKFLISLPSQLISGEFKQHYHFAWACLLAQAKKFSNVYEILSNNIFSPEYHRRLQNLWFECHYKEEENRKGRNLNPVEKYRLRRKYQPPPTISSGERTVYNMMESTLETLYRVFEKSKYPDHKQKLMLVRETQLSMDQINNWFKNRRQRLKRNMYVGKTK